MIGIINAKWSAACQFTCTQEKNNTENHDYFNYYLLLCIMMLFTCVIYYFIKLCIHLFTENTNDDNIIINIDYLSLLLFVFTSYNGCKLEKLQWTLQNVNFIATYHCLLKYCEVILGPWIVQTIVRWKFRNSTSCKFVSVCLILMRQICFILSVYYLSKTDWKIGRKEGLKMFTWAL